MTNCLSFCCFLSVSVIYTQLSVNLPHHHVGQHYHRDFSIICQLNSNHCWVNHLSVNFHHCSVKETCQSCVSQLLLSGRPVNQSSVSQLPLLFCQDLSIMCQSTSIIVLSGRPVNQSSVSQLPSLFCQGHLSIMCQSTSIIVLSGRPVNHHVLTKWQVMQTHLILH